MAYRVLFKPSAAAAVRKLPRKAQRRVLSAAAALGRDPRPRGAKKLRGVKDLYRVRTGDCRIVYQIQGDVLVVLVLKVGHRRDVYRGH